MLGCPCFKFLHTEIQFKMTSEAICDFLSSRIEAFTQATPRPAAKKIKESNRVYSNLLPSKFKIVESKEKNSTFT